VADSSTVYFVNQNGDVVGVDPSQAAALAHNPAFRPATKEEVWDASGQYSGAGQSVIAGLEGAGRALTLGGLTPLEKLLGADPEGIEAREALHPIASGIGTAVGVAAPLILSGGAAAPLEAGAGALEAGAEGAGLATRLASRTAPAAIARLGEAVGTKAAELAPDFIGQVGKRLVKGAAGSAIEGIAYGLGQEVHESMLPDSPEFTASSALQTIGLNALLGGTLGLGGSLTSEVAGKIAGRFNAGDAANKLQGWLEKSEALNWLKVGGAKKADISKIVRRAGSQQAGREELLNLGRDGNQLGIVDALATPQKVFDRSTQVMEDASSDMAQLLRAADAKVLTEPKLQPDLYGVIDQVRRDDLEPLTKNGATPEAADGLAGVLARYQKIADDEFKEKLTQARLAGFKDTFSKQFEGKVSFDRMHEIRKELDDRIFGLRGTKDAHSTPLADALHDFRNGVSQEISESMAEAGLDSAAWKAANRRYSVGRQFQKISSGALDAEEGNNKLSLTEGLSILSGLVGGGIPGAAVAGLGTIGLHRYSAGLLAKGAQVLRGALATAPETVTALGALERNNATVGRRIADAAAAFMKKGPPVMKAALLAESPEIMDRMEKVNALANDPQTLQATIAKLIDPLADHAPQTAQALATTLARTVSLLGAQTPKGKAPFPLSKPSNPSRSDLIRWHHLFRAANEPVDVLEKGPHTAETMGLIEAAHPALWSKWTGALTEQVADTLGDDKTIPYQQRLALSRMLGQDMDGSLTLLAANQAVQAVAAQEQQQHEQQPHVKLGGLEKMKVAYRLETPTQRLLGA
jgi:hypothetical protein